MKTYNEFYNEARIVKDKKTGREYDPDVEFHKLMHHPDTVALLKRMKNETSKGDNYSQTEAYVAYNDNDAKEHFVDFLASHLSPDIAHKVHKAINTYPMKNKNGIVHAAVNAGADLTSATRAYLAVKLDYDGKYE